MYSFYGGQKGQDLLAKQIFDSCFSMLNDLTKGLGSKVEIGQYVAISYGSTENGEYFGNKAKDQEAEYIGYYNGSFWEKNQINWNEKYPTSKYIHTSINGFIAITVNKQKEYPVAYYFSGNNVGYERKLDLGCLPHFTAEVSSFGESVPGVRVTYDSNDTAQPKIEFEFPDLYFVENTSSQPQGAKSGDYIFDKTTGIFYQINNGQLKPLGSVVVAPIVEVNGQDAYDISGNPNPPSAKVEKGDDGKPYKIVFSLPKMPTITASVVNTNGENLASVTTTKNSSNNSVDFNFKFDFSKLDSLSLRPKYGMDYQGSYNISIIKEQLDSKFPDIKTGEMVALTVSDGQSQTAYWAFKIVDDWTIIPITTFVSETFAWAPLSQEDNSYVIYEGGVIPTGNGENIKTDSGEGK